MIDERLRKTRQLLEAKEIDAVLITNPNNRRYLSGFDGSSGALLIGFAQAFLVTDFRYVDQAAAQADRYTVHRWKDDFYRSLVPLIEEAGWSKLGFESGHVVFSAYGEMKEKLPVELVPLEQTAETQRLIKNEEELSIMRRGARELDGAFEHIRSFIRPGLTEKEVALELEVFLRRRSAEEPSFRFIVASGERGALPHGVASDKVMQEGELVTIDFGAVYRGYATDMTRTVALGEPGQRCREIYDLVYRAQREAAAAARPGITASELDVVARDLITAAGRGEYFGHGLGHGVGLETHEKPLLNSRSETVLEPGMVMTIEPGVYLPGLGGVRIEDMVCITEEGAEILTQSLRELIII